MHLWYFTIVTMMAHIYEMHPGFRSHVSDIHLLSPRNPTKQVPFNPQLTDEETET